MSANLIQYRKEKDQKLRINIYKTLNKKDQIFWKENILIQEDIEFIDNEIQQREQLMMKLLQEQNNTKQKRLKDEEKAFRRSITKQLPLKKKYIK